MENTSDARVSSKAESDRMSVELSSRRTGVERSCGSKEFICLDRVYASPSDRVVVDRRRAPAVVHDAPYLCERMRLPDALLTLRMPSS